MGVAPEILATTLEHYGHGRAMWCPEPPEDADGRAREIRVGDVGHLDEDGGFRRLFNVTVDEDHELNKGGVPEGFVPLRFNKRLLSVRSNQFLPTAFCSRTVKTKEVEGHAQASAGSVAGASLAYNFQLSSASGGLLILRDQADKISVPSAASITQYIRLHHDSWYQFATNPETYGLECKPEDIIMVRGFVKTSAWAVAAFNDSGNHLHSVDFSGQAGPFADAGFHLSAQQQKSALFEHRVGPLRKDPRSPTPSSISHSTQGSISSITSRGTGRLELPEVEYTATASREAVPDSTRDQAVFLGYYKIKKRFWGGKKIRAAGEAQDTPSSDDDHDHEPDSAVELHPQPMTHRTALDDVLDYILKHSDAEIAITSDGAISDLFMGNPLPEDMNFWLQETMPTIDVDENKAGTLSTLEAIRREHVAAAAEQEIAAGAAWEARQAELIALQERAEAEAAILAVLQQQEREQAEFLEGSSGQQAGDAASTPADPAAAAEVSTGTAVPTEAPAEAMDEDATAAASAPPVSAPSDTVPEAAPSTSAEMSTSDVPAGEPSDDPEHPLLPEGTDPFDLPLTRESSIFMPDIPEERLSGTCVTADGHIIVDNAEGGSRDSGFPHTILLDKSAEGGGVSSISVSKSGRFIATGCEDCFVRIWDLEVGTLTSKMEKHEDTVWTVAFSPDGTRLVSGSADKKAIMWNVQTHEYIREMTGHEGDVWLADYSPDSKFVATGSVDCTVRLWDGRRGNHLTTLEGHNAVVMGVKFSPDGKRLATYADNIGHLWDVASGQATVRLQGHSSVIWSLAFSSDSTRIVTAAEDQSSRVWDVETGDELVIINEHTGPVWSTVFSPDGLQVASGSYDTLVIVVDSFTSEKFHTLEREPSSIVNILAYSADGEYLAAGYADGSVRVYDARSGGFVAEFRGHEDKVKTVEFMPDDNRLVTSSDDGTVRIWGMVDALRL